MCKIKILAAILALAGCMENGIGMEENEINGHNVIIRSLEDKNLSQIIEQALPDDDACLTLDGIDFSKHSLDNINSTVGSFFYITFKDCSNFPFEISGLKCATDLAFLNCNERLGYLSGMVKNSCDLNCLRTCSFINSDATMLDKGFWYEYLVETFNCCNFFVQHGI